MASLIVRRSFPAPFTVPGTGISRRAATKPTLRLVDGRLIGILHRRETRSSLNISLFKGIRRRRRALANLHQPPEAQKSRCFSGFSVAHCAPPRWPPCCAILAWASAFSTAGRAADQCSSFTSRQAAPHIPRRTRCPNHPAPACQPSVRLRGGRSGRAHPEALSGWRPGS